MQRPACEVEEASDDAQFLHLAIDTVLRFNHFDFSGGEAVVENTVRAYYALIAIGYGTFA